MGSKASFSFFSQNIFFDKILPSYLPALLKEPPINDFLSDLSLYRGHLYTVSLVHLELIVRLVENEYNNLKMPDLPELPWANHRKYHPAPEV